MYTEIIKIIEGGLTNDKEKIINYANVFANNLETQGELSLAKKIRNVINRNRSIQKAEWILLKSLCQMLF